MARSLVYIDLNMVRAGVVAHPREWASSGYHEIQQPRLRYRIIDREALAAALEVDLASCREWIDDALARRDLQRQSPWTESIAAGGQGFCGAVATALGSAARSRDIAAHGSGLYVLREPMPAYGHQNTPKRTPTTPCYGSPKPG